MANSDEGLIERWNREAAATGALADAYSHVVEAMEQLQHEDLASAVEQYGFARENLRKATMLSQGFTKTKIETTAEISLSPAVIKLLNSFKTIESFIATYCS